MGISLQSHVVQCATQGKMTTHPANLIQLQSQRPDLCSSANHLRPSVKHRLFNLSNFTIQLVGKTYFNATLLNLTLRKPFSFYVFDHPMGLLFPFYAGHITVCTNRPISVKGNRLTENFLRELLSHLQQVSREHSS